MTRNFHRDGDPSGPWACAARSPRGEFGVSIGCGDAQIAFVPEAALEAFIATAARTTPDFEHLPLVRAAAEQLPNFKRTVQKRDSAFFN
jgi:hypothetical protein